MPSIFADRWHQFRSWSYTLTCSVPKGETFSAWWDEADLESVLMRPWLDARSVAGQLAAPFWIRSLAWSPDSVRDPRLLPRRSTPVHAHLVLGNVSRDLVDTLRALWPQRGRFVRVESITAAKGRAWGAIHYCLSQTRIAPTASNYFARVKLDHHLGHDALATWPVESPSIDLHAAVAGLAPRAPVTPGVRARFAALARRRWSSREISVPRDRATPYRQTHNRGVKEPRTS